MEPESIKLIEPPSLALISLKSNFVDIFMTIRCSVLVGLLLFIPVTGWSDDPPATSKRTLDKKAYVSFPAVGLKLVQPEGFQKDESFHGFGQPDTKSSVVAVKLPGPFSQVSAGFTTENLQARGWTLKSKKAIEIDGLSGFLIHFQQPAGGIEFLKWAVVFGDEEKTFLVTATFPESHAGELSDRLKAAVTSVRLDTGETPPPGADLNFTITASPKLKLATQLGKNLLYTKNGKIPAESPQDPMFVVGRSLGAVEISKKREFAESRLRQTAHTEITKIQSTKAIRIAGLSGFESLADATDEKSGVPLQVYQVILFSDDAYYLMQGLVGAEQAKTYLPEFEAMAKRFQLTKANASKTPR